MSPHSRCEWADSDPLMIDYHDHEWGTPQHDDHMLFEFLVLEGAQAGLSWATILKKRENYRRAFARFDPARVARFNRRSVERLLGDAGIVRNRLKVESAISNARCYLNIQDEFDSFDSYLWAFTGGAPVTHRYHRLRDLPAQTEVSEALSKGLRARGFRFVGPTICYAFMQAVGMVNDHVIDCFRYKELT